MDGLATLPDRAEPPLADPRQDVRACPANNGDDERDLDLPFSFVVARFAISALVLELAALVLELAVLVLVLAALVLELAALVLVLAALVLELAALVLELAALVLVSDRSFLLVLSTVV